VRVVETKERTMVKIMKNAKPAVAKIFAKKDTENQNNLAISVSFWQNRKRYFTKKFW